MEQVLSNGQKTLSSSPPNTRLLPLAASADQVLGPAPHGVACTQTFPTWLLLPRVPPLLQALGTPSLSSWVGPRLSLAGAPPPGDGG